MCLAAPPTQLGLPLLEAPHEVDQPWSPNWEMGRTDAEAVSVAWYHCIGTGRTGDRPLCPLRWASVDRFVRAAKE